MNVFFVLVLIISLLFKIKSKFLFVFSLSFLFFSFLAFVLDVQNLGRSLTIYSYMIAFAGLLRYFAESKNGKI